MLRCIEQESLQKALVSTLRTQSEGLLHIFTSTPFPYATYLNSVYDLCSTPQINTWTSDWIEFYGVHRLGYQLKLARQQFGDSLIYEKGSSFFAKVKYTDKKCFTDSFFMLCEGQRLIKNMAPLFNGAVLEPCLLHGDLWSGNISYDKNGEPLILDPACYCKST